METEYDDLLKRYYRGETTLEEERLLKAAYREGRLEDEPALALGSRPAGMPVDLSARIQARIHKKARRRFVLARLAVGSVAAMVVLILSLRALQPASSPVMPLADHLKKERFEDALRIIGCVLDEKTPPVQKVLYEDDRLIIAVE